MTFYTLLPWRHKSYGLLLATGDQHSAALIDWFIVRRFPNGSERGGYYPQLLGIGDKLGFTWQSLRTANVVSP